MPSLLTPFEVDEILRYKPGRAARLARRKVLPHVELPDGTIRFRRDDIEQLIGTVTTTGSAPAAEEACAHVG